MHRLPLALSLFLASPVALACSVAPGYRVPSTLELVEEADAIVIAEPFAPREIDEDDPQILFAAIFQLKSDRSDDYGRRIAAWVPGIAADGQTSVVPSDPRELVRAHPDAYSGGCIRYIFDPESRVLLFLKREGESYRALSYPFARTAEDAPGFNGLWAKTVREYVAIAALPPALRRARMERRRDLLRRLGDADSRAIADDFERELNAPRKPLREPLPPTPE